MVAAILPRLHRAAFLRPSWCTGLAATTEPAGTTKARLHRADRGNFMPQYLSQEWLDQFVKMSADQPIRPGVTVKVQYKITDGPAGDIDYYWIVDGGRIVDAKRGTIGDSDFAMTSSYDDQAKMQRGELDPTAAFMKGKLKVCGDVAKLLSLLPITSSPEWKSLQDEMAAITEY
ncbi:MAG: SCP2 sterol-binding domain-containing protein [Actinomycetota bacterium]